MAVERVVVEVHLRVEREQVAVVGDDERVDLDERRVGGDERLVDAPIISLTAWLTCGPCRPSAKASFRAWNGSQPDAGMHELLEDPLGRLLGDLLDLDAAVRADHHHRLARWRDRARGPDTARASICEPLLDEHALRRSARRGRSGR